MFKAKRNITVQTDFGEFRLINAQFVESKSWATTKSGVVYIVNGTLTAPDETHIDFLTKIDAKLQELSPTITQILLKNIQEIDDEIIFDRWEQYFNLKTILVRRIHENQIFWQIRFEQKREGYDLTLYFTGYNIDKTEIDYT